MISSIIFIFGGSLAYCSILNIISNLKNNITYIG